MNEDDKGQPSGEQRRSYFSMPRLQAISTVDAERLKVFILRKGPGIFAAQPRVTNESSDREHQSHGERRTGVGCKFRTPERKGRKENAPDNRSQCEATAMTGGIVMTFKFSFIKVQTGIVGTGKTQLNIGTYSKWIPS